MSGCTNWTSELTQWWWRLETTFATWEGWNKCWRTLWCSEYVKNLNLENASKQRDIKQKLLSFMVLAPNSGREVRGGFIRLGDWLISLTLDVLFLWTEWKLEGFWCSSDNIMVRFGIPMTGSQKYQREGYVWMVQGNSELHLGCIYLFLISSTAENVSGK